MAKYSGATYRPLATKQGQPAMSSHDIVCLHTMVGNLTSTDNMFHENGWGGTESHFGVGGKWGPDAGKGWDGKVFQWQDTGFTADANFQGNHHVISIETADNAPSKIEDIAVWTPAQLDSIVKLVAWACKTYDIPAVLVADSKPGRRGIAYHRQGCEHSDGLGSHPGWLVKGGERWSTSLGKGCPGPARIAQLRDIVIPRVNELLSGDIVTPGDIDKIVSEIVAVLRPVIRAEIIHVITTEKLVPNKPTNPGDPAAGSWTLAGVLAAEDQKTDQQGETLAAILKAVAPPV